MNAPRYLVEAVKLKRAVSYQPSAISKNGGSLLIADG
jgi:hypothetical protein